MTAPSTDISDYSGYDYKQEFWVKSNRHYEDACEKATVRRLLKRIPGPINHLVDIGCGFGRLFPAYHDLAKAFTLTDYAQELLTQAKSTIQTSAPIQFVQADIYKAPFNDDQFDVGVSIRTLHHLKPEPFIAQLARIIKPNGHILIEIPNQRHILNRLKYRLGRLPQNPNTTTPLDLGKTFWNYHPAVIEALLRDHGFTIKKRVATSFFRHPRLKQLLPTALLVTADIVLQHLLSWTDIPPSILILAKKKG